mmetsp:Transcript_132153/g.254391  ORF Transcript_132153/g.254391 Transcript_132153/m.254391 type:complete len:269 (-) Transcript_132153:196-1002(-)
MCAREQILKAFRRPLVVLRFLATKFDFIVVIIVLRQHICQLRFEAGMRLTHRNLHILPQIHFHLILIAENLVNLCPDGHQEIMFSARSSRLILNLRYHVGQSLARVLLVLINHQPQVLLHLCLPPCSFFAHLMLSNLHCSTHVHAELSNLHSQGCKVIDQELHVFAQSPCFTLLLSPHLVYLCLHNCSHIAILLYSFLQSVYLLGNISQNCTQVLEGSCIVRLEQVQHTLHFQLYVALQRCTPFLLIGLYVFEQTLESGLQRYAQLSF